MVVIENIHSLKRNCYRFLNSDCCMIFTESTEERKRERFIIRLLWSEGLRTDEVYGSVSFQRGHKCMGRNLQVGAILQRGVGEFFLWYAFLVVFEA